MAISILMPALSPTMTEGTLASWQVKEGDVVQSGQVLAEIETDKAVMEVEAVDEGVLAKILVPAGSESVAVNSVIALLAEEGEDPATVSVPSDTNAPVNNSTNEAKASAVSPQAAPQKSTSGSSGSRIFASPLARRLAAEAGLDLASLKGSGPHGRIVKRDIEAAIAAGPIAAELGPKAASTQAGMISTDLAGPAPYEVVPLNTMRKTIARRLSEAKSTVPHFYLSVDIELDQLLAARKALNTAADGAYKLSVNDLIIKACGMALMKVPKANATWADEGIRLYQRADISVAVATDGGLITPVVRGANLKGLAAISTEMKDLAERARASKLMPEEYQGGSFTLSNLGMFGVKQFQAIINPPQASILAVGAGVEQPVSRNGKIETATVMSATLSVDHRAVDGALGAQLLQAIKGYIETPLSMLA